MKVIVVGLGSIGRQHLATLESLKKQYRLDIVKFSPISHSPAVYFKELKLQIQNYKVDVAVICNPTVLHLETLSLCLKLGLHVFVEKPISHDYNPQKINGLIKLAKRKDLKVMVGYDMRFNPWIRKVKELIDENTVGEIWGMRIIAGQYLPNWRNTDYRDTYSAKKSLGGGVLLDLSHEIDYLTWLFKKKIRYVTARKIYSKQIQIETEDVCSMILEYSDRSIAEIHLDYLNIPYRRSMEVYGEKGTLVWDGNLNTILVYSTSPQKPIVVGVDKVSGKDILKSEVKHFFDCIEQQQEPLNSLVNALYVNKIIDRMNKSAFLGTTVRF